MAGTRTGQGMARQGKAKQSKAKQSKAKQDSIVQDRTGQHRTARFSFSHALIHFLSTSLSEKFSVS